jgi:hypothetical protein
MGQGGKDVGGQFRLGSRKKCQDDRHPKNQGRIPEIFLPARERSSYSCENHRGPGEQARGANEKEEIPGTEAVVFRGQVALEVLLRKKEMKKSRVTMLHEKQPGKYEQA